MQWAEQQKGILSEGRLLNSRSHRRNNCLSPKRETECLSRDPTAPKQSIQGLPEALEEFLDLEKKEEHNSSS